MRRSPRSRLRDFAIRLAVVALTGLLLLTTWLNSELSARFFDKLIFLRSVEREARNNSLDRSAMLALIFVESSFNPRARSSKGAAGLMQLMPVTAREIGEALGYRSDEVDLEDPSLNIQFGAYYLARLRARYGSWERVLQAYNAGSRTVDELEPDAEHPFEETRQFVMRVQDWQWRFNCLLAIKDYLTFGGE